MNLGEILDVEVIRRLRRLFFEYTGMVSSLYFPDSKLGQIDCIPRDAQCEFCKIMHRCPRGAEQCALSDQQAAESIQKTMKPIVFTCYAGLTGIAAPVFYEGECQGAVLAGSVLTHVPTAASFMKVRRALKGIDVDLDELEKAYYKVPVVSHRFIRLAVEQLSLIVNYIIDREQIIGLQQRLYEKQEEISNAIMTHADTEKGLKDQLAEVDKLRKQLSVVTNPDSIAVVSDDKGARRKRIAETILSFVDQYYTAGITLNDVADKVGLSPNYVSTLFHDECGLTLMDYIVAKRIEKARELLQELSMNVGEVRTRVGYSNISHFNRTFKKIVGVTPGEYRNRIVLQRKDAQTDE